MSERHGRDAEAPSKGPGKHRKAEWPPVDPDKVTPGSEATTALPKRGARSRWFTPEGS